MLARKGRASYLGERSIGHRDPGAVSSALILRARRRGGRMTVKLVVVSHSEKIADGAVELAAQMAPDVLILPAGGTDDGRIGTSLERVMAALEQAADANSDGTVVLTDLGSAVMTAESALEFLADPSSVLLADAPLVEGLVAAAVAAQAGADSAGVKEAAEAVYRPPAAPQHVHEHRPPEATGDFELINQAGMHARPAAKICRRAVRHGRRGDSQRRRRRVDDGAHDARGGEGNGAAR